MMQYIEMKDLLHGRLNILDAGVTKFDNLVAIRADQVVMLLVSVGLFVLREIFSELMF
jgi:hypothetical protein